MTMWHGAWRGVICAVVLAVLVALIMPVRGVGAADGATPQTAIARPEVRLGRTGAAQQFPVALPLVPNEAALAAFLHDASDPASPQYRRYLTPAQFTARFVDASARREAQAFLRGAGFTLTDSGIGALVTATGTAAQIERAFAVELNDYRDATGRTFVAADRTAALPASLAPKVRGVVGLDTASRHRPRFVETPRDGQTARAVAPRTPSGCGGAVNEANTYNSFVPNQLATAYNFDALYSTGRRGEGQTVAVFELDNYDDANVATFQSCFGTNVPVSRVAVDGGSPYVNASLGQVEVELDIEVIIGMAPKLAGVLVYHSPNTWASLVNNYQRIANDNAAQVVSTSWGLCESSVDSSSPGTRAAENAIFQQMAAQGQTIFAASGDYGTDDCGGGVITVDDPASQPYVSGVGGTFLALNASTNAYAGERVWNDYSSGHGAGGGGISGTWGKPAWQTGPGTSNSFSNGKRQVPDVAANADVFSAYVIYSQGYWRSVGGTSAGAPLWAAGTALLNQSIGGRIGFGNPVWYRVATAAPGAFHDITVGDNCYSSSCGMGTSGAIFPTTAGYDQASGVGTMNLGILAFALRPTLTSLSPTSGPQNGGTAVTLRGTYFRGGLIVTFGGQAATGVTIVNDTTLTVITPPSPVSAQVDIVVRAPDTGDTATLVNAFTYIAPSAAPRSSAPTPSPAVVPNVAPVSGRAAPTVAPTAVGATATPTPNPAPPRRAG